MLNTRNYYDEPIILATISKSGHWCRPNLSLSFKFLSAKCFLWYRNEYAEDTLNNMLNKKALSLNPCHIFFIQICRQVFPCLLVLESSLRAGNDKSVFTQFITEWSAVSYYLHSSSKRKALELEIAIVSSSFLHPDFSGSPVSTAG